MLLGGSPMVETQPHALERSPRRSRRPDAVRMQSHGAAHVVSWRTRTCWISVSTFVTFSGYGRRRPWNSEQEGMMFNWLRGGAAAVFARFGVAKFTAHASEVSSFRSYGLPAPDAFVYAIGALEIVGALLLAAGLLTRLAAAALAGDMIAAIVVSGLAKGEVLSLTLAPALLVSMIAECWIGPRHAALDTRLLGRARKGRAGMSRRS